MKRYIPLLLLLLLALTGCSSVIVNPNPTGDTNSPTKEPAASAVVEITVKDYGVITAELYADTAPITVENFLKLVDEKFYDGLTFHRVISGFMIQGGDPTGTGMGGPGYTIDDEFGPGLAHSGEGILSMANAGPNTGGSQFFINTVDNTYLDKEDPRTPYAHPVFGEVVSGMDVVDKIGRVETDRNDKPLSDVVIEKAEVVE